jgi:hypothetical protein
LARPIFSDFALFNENPEFETEVRKVGQQLNTLSRSDFPISRDFARSRYRISVKNGRAHPTTAAPNIGRSGDWLGPTVTGWDRQSTAS